MQLIIIIIINLKIINSFNSDGDITFPIKRRKDYVKKFKK